MDVGRVGRWTSVLGVVLLAASGGAAQEAGVPAGAPAAEVSAPAAGEPMSVFYTRPGRFEIVVQKAADAQGALELGRVVWSTLSGPLGLPADGFSSPVSVRLVPAAMWRDASAFTVTAEPPGLVVVRVRWAEDVDPLVVRRAFVQGLLMRLAVSWHGASPSLTVPLWLEHACTCLSRVRERPALLDQFQQESTNISVPPPLRALLQWKRGGVESRAWELSALWLLLHLQAEPGDANRWGNWLRGITAGAAPLETLPRHYTGLWTDFSAMEVWWQAGFHHQRRVRGTPLMTPETSRAWLAERSRWLAVRGGREVVLGLGELESLRKEPWVRAEMTERLKQSGAILGAIHPYYANAAISLGKLYEVSLKGDAKAAKEALEQFERDAVDGRELEDTVNEILNTAPRD